jgi:hypothetical protein
MRAHTNGGYAVRRPSGDHLGGACTPPLSLVAGVGGPAVTLRTNTRRSGAVAVWRGAPHAPSRRFPPGCQEITDW